MTAEEEVHLQNCPHCGERVKLAGDDTVFEEQLREAESDAPRFMMTPTAVLGDYELVREIGRGGMGVVYEAVQRSLGRPVALKVLPPLLHSLRPESGERFRAEAAAAARLQHPNIVPIYDYGVEQGCHYYAMELICGRSLGEVIKEAAGEAELPGARSASAGRTAQATEVDYFRKVAGWMADIAEALSFAHDAGVVHRDIKPNNLILSDSGRVLITDFGLAKDLNEDPVTHTGQLMGTWRYMSPEQVRDGGAEVDQRTDIYSLGATLYELLVLQPAIPGGPDHEMLQRVLEHEPLAPRRINPNIPLELEIICRKAMCKEAATRYQSAAELADDLRRFLSGEPIRARSSALHLRVLKYLRRHRFTVAVVLVGVFLTTSVISTAAYLDAARERTEQNNATTAVLVRSARKHFDAGHYAMATQVYSNVLARDSSLAYVHVLRALVRGELGRLSGAAEDLDAVIALDPRRSGSYYQRGVLQLIRGEPAAAAADLRQALQLDAHNHRARIFLHLCEAEFPETGSDTDATTLSWTADSTTATGYLVALLEHFESDGDPSEAVSAAPTSGSRAVVCCAIAARFARRGEQEQAETWYKKSIQANDTPSLVRLYCRKRLEELSGR